MSWSKTEHDGQVMWERDGERVRQPPKEINSHNHNKQHDNGIGAILIIGFFRLFGWISRYFRRIKCLSLDSSVSIS